MKEDFAQAEQYDGFREGYVFKKGSQGLGCGFPSLVVYPCTVPAAVHRRQCLPRPRFRLLTTALPPSRYYRDRGPKGPWDPFDVNTGVVVRDREYDMDKHVNPQPGLRGLVAWPQMEKRHTGAHSLRAPTCIHAYVHTNLENQATTLNVAPGS
jgi:hypothetical protein